MALTPGEIKNIFQYLLDYKIVIKELPVPSISWPEKTTTITIERKTKYEIAEQR